MRNASRRRKHENIIARAEAHSSIETNADYVFALIVSVKNDWMKKTVILDNYYTDASELAQDVKESFPNISGVEVIDYQENTLAKC